MLYPHESDLYVCERFRYIYISILHTNVPQIPMRNRLHPSKEHSVLEFKEPQLESPPNWNFQTHIGTGGFAKVYKESITRPVTGKHLCAVKRIFKEDVKFPRKLYEREIKIFSKLKHQNDWFVQYFDSYSDAQHIYIVMEYMEWGDLVPYIRDRWDASDAAIVAHQLLCGLQYLHQNGITHRDLKPAVSIIPFKASLDFQS